MSSRSANDLHPWLRRVWEISASAWQSTHPNGPVVFLSCTYRSKEEQTALYAQGRTKPGKKVTNSQAGQSLHNYNPAFAFDVCFHEKGNPMKLIWDVKVYQEFALLPKQLGAEWGGDWKSIKDNPHFEVPGFSWQDAAAGKHPINLPEIQSGK